MSGLMAVACTMSGLMDGAFTMSGLMDGAFTMSGPYFLCTKYTQNEYPTLIFSPGSSFVFRDGSLWAVLAILFSFTLLKNAAPLVHITFLTKDMSAYELMFISYAIQFY